MSLELLPALISTGPRHDRFAGEAGIGEEAHRHRKGDRLRCSGLQVEPGKADDLLSRERHTVAVSAA
jgi:hypothetical protein